MPRLIYVVMAAALFSLIPVSLVRLGPVDVDPFKLMLAFAVVVYGASVVVHRDMRVIPADRQMVFLFGLLALGIASGLWAKDSLRTLSYAFGLSMWILFYLLVVLFTRTWGDLERWSYCLPLAMLVALAYNLQTYLELHGIRHSTGNVEVGILGALGSYALLPIAYIYLFSRRLVSSLLCVLLMVCVGIALILSANRIASLVVVFNLVAFGLVLVGSSWVSRERKKRFARFFLLSLATGVAAFFLLISTSHWAPKLYSARMLGTISPEYRYYKRSFYWRDNLRLNLWDAGLRMAAASPIQGVGLGNFKEEILSYYTYWEYGRLAHNIYLSQLAETGPVGLALLLLLLGAAAYQYRTTAKSLRHSRREREFILVKIYEIMFWGLLIHSAFRPTLYEFPVYLFLAVSACSANIMQARKVAA